MSSLTVCISGALGAIGRVLVPAVVAADDFSLHPAASRRELGRDIGEVLGGAALGVPIEDDIERALDRRPDVLIDYTHPAVVRRHVALALERHVPVVIGTTGLSTTTSPRSTRPLARQAWAWRRATSRSPRPSCNTSPASRPVTSRTSR